MQNQTAVSLPATTKAPKSGATDKARLAGIAAIQKRLDGPLADAPTAAPAAATPEVVAIAAAGSPRPPKASKPKAAKPAAKKAAPAPAKPAAKQPAKPAKVAKGAPKLSAMSAAAQVLAASKEPLNVKQIIAEMSAKGLWTSPGGKTPHATLAAALMRDIAAKGRESRFKKVDRGMFTASGR